MLKRYSLRYTLLSLLLDIAAITGALAIAQILRRTLPYGRVGFYPNGIPPVEVYGIAAALWLATAITVSLYNAKRVYKAVDVGQTIPQTLFVAVAEVLAMIYRLRKQRGTVSSQG